MNVWKLCVKEMEDISSQRKDIESYYDSDEEVAWGPLSLREIKSDLKRPRQRITRRETAIGYKSYDYNVLKENIDTSNTDGNMDATTKSSEYLTANESLRSVSNTNFLDKLSKVINSPSKSHYFTTMRESMALDKMAVTLVENTIILSSDEEDNDEVIVLSDDSDSNEDLAYHSFGENNNRKTIKKEDLSETSYETAKLDIDPDSLVAKFEEISTSYKTARADTTTEAHEVSKFGEEEETLTDDDMLEITHADCKEISAHLQKNVLQYEHKFNENDVLEFDDLGVAKLPNSTIDSSEQNRSSSPIEVPEIDINQFDESDDFSMSRKFNDTLEEIEHALKYGLGYEMSEDEPVKLSSPTPKEVSPKPSPTPSRLKTSPTRLKTSPSRLKTSPSRLMTSPSRLKTSPSRLKTSACSLMTSPSPLKSKTDDIFKIPATPSYSKIPVAMRLKPHTNKFHDIISPVKVYINNTPKMCLKQNIPDRKLQPPTFQKPKTHIRNTDDIIMHFPEVIYKPAKENITSKTRQINLPPSIKKLVTETQIIKHEKRICQQSKNVGAIHRKLVEREGDLTTIDDSILNHDISILTSKPGFIR